MNDAESGLASFGQIVYSLIWNVWEIGFYSESNQKATKEELGVVLEYGGFLR